MHTDGRPVLLVEDDPADVDLAFRAFQELRVANPIFVCRDGEEALHYMQAHGSSGDEQLPALVLLDLHLPKVDGMDVLRRARTDDVWRKIPVVVLTTSREHRDIEAAYGLGVNSYIVKPVDFLRFAEIISAITTYWLLTNEPPFPARNGR